MQLPEPLHRWDVSGKEAGELQRRLRSKVRLSPLPPHIKLIAGADLALSRKDGLVFSAVAVLSFPDLEVVEVTGACLGAAFPYIPGLLSFREGPALIEAFRKLENKPDVIIFDGQGIAHPRRLGLAAHLGLFLQMPAAGCAKSRLTGEYAEPGRRKGCRQPLTDAGQVLGAVVRTRSNVKPVFVSPGHLCDIAGAIDIVLKCSKSCRLPEPVRIAHIRAGRMKRRFVDKKS